MLAGQGKKICIVILEDVNVLETVRFAKCQNWIQLKTILQCQFLDYGNISQ